MDPVCIKVKVVKVVDLYSASTRRVSKTLGYSTHSRGITQFYLHTGAVPRGRPGGPRSPVKFLAQCSPKKFKIRPPLAKIFC